MSNVKILSLEEKTNSKGIVYFVVYLSENCQYIYETLEEALENVPHLAKFCHESIRIERQKTGRF